MSTLFVNDLTLYLKMARNLKIGIFRFLLVKVGPIFLPLLDKATNQVEKIGPGFLPKISHQPRYF